MELAQIPAWYFTYHIVQSRFEECAGGLCHGILQIKQTVTQTKFGGNKSKRITCSLGSQCRRARKTGINLYDTVVLRFGVERILHIAFSHNTDVTDDANSQLAKFMILRIGKSLRRSNDDGLSGMNAQRVKVLHITNGDAVIITVTDHFILHFLPAFQTLFHQHLRREREGFFGQNIQFFFIIAET